MKKPMIKALAFATAITMVFSTPLTALADGLASLYAEGSGEGTGTHGTGTGSGTKDEDHDIKDEDHDIKGEEPDEEVQFKIVGVLLDKPEMTVIAGEVYEEDILTATLVMQRETSDFAGRIETVTVNSSNIDMYSNVKVLLAGEVTTTNQILQKSIVWDVVENSEAVSLETANNADNRQVKVIGQKQGDAVVRVGIQNLPEYEAFSKVKVKSYSRTLTFKKFGKMYAKHKIDVKNDYFTQDGNDDITWSVNEVGKRGKSTSYASISANGVLTLKKVTKGKKLEVVATSEKGITKASEAFEIEAGNPVTKLKMSVGSKYTFTLPNDKAKDFSVDVTTKGGSATTDFIKWTSSNNKVVTVVEKKPNVEGESKVATVTPVGPGKATITATSTSGKKAKVTVTVKAPLQDITGIKGEGRDHIYTGQKIQLIAVTKPAVCDEASKIKFKLTDKKRDGKLATVSSKGVLQTKNQAGEVEITASYKKISKSFKVKIEPNKLTSVRITKLPAINVRTQKPTLTYIAGQMRPHKLDAEINKEATKDMVYWSSSNTKVATVDQNGVVTPLKPGKVKITAGGGTCTPDVREIVVQQAVERIELSKANVTVQFKNAAKKSYTTTLKVSKFYPKGVKKEKVRWAIASVDDGKFRVVDNITDSETGIGIDKDKGKLTIPASVKNGTVVKVRAFCETGATAIATVTLCNPTQKVTIAAGKKADLTIGSKPYELNSKNVVIEAKKGFDNKDYNEKIVSYTANNNNVNLVRIKDGYAVYGAKPGKSVVTVKTASGKSAKITFTVKAAN